MNRLVTMVWTLAQYYHTFGLFGLILLGIGLVVGIRTLVKIAGEMAE